MPLRSLRYRRRYGQHFLNSRRIAQRIVDFAHVDEQTVCEIGAGKGILTRLLAQRADKVFAVEIDPALAARLNDGAASNVEVVHNDFLKINIADFGTPVIVGNIPYSITTEILDNLIAQKKNVSRAVMMLQKEYGDRLLASVGSPVYGALTIYANYYFFMQKGFTVSARYFTPRPKVNSVVLSFRKKDPAFPPQDETDFFDFVKTVFRYRRKSLRNSLMQVVESVPDDVEKDILTKRPQNVTCKELYGLYRACRV
jgi:16S rRNA (adenine1518-N6/adenine1519-N6)-dimethyltransferase